MISQPLKVKDLLENLNKLDSDARVVFVTEDEEWLESGHSHRLLDVILISGMDGEPVRGDDQIPAIKWGKSNQSIKLAVIQLTSDI